MRCKKCKTELRYTGNKNLVNCVICGVPMTPDMDDIFTYKMYGITEEQRPIQTEMAKTIDSFYRSEDDKVLIVEGGTGVGKSFAYLIPALKYAITDPYTDEEGNTKIKRLVISTAKKTLQEQLIKKDIPLLLNKMEIEASFTQLKGNADYLCLNKTTAVPLVDREYYLKKVKQAKTAKDYVDLSRWKKERPPWWENVNVDTCPNTAGCPHSNYCKPKAKQYDIIVVNHHILAIDLIDPGHLLGEYHYLIIDEAHQAPEALRSAYTKTITNKRTKYMCKEFTENINLRTSLSDYIHRDLKDTLLNMAKTIHEETENLINYAEENKNKCNCVNPIGTQIRKILRKLAPNTSRMYNELESAKKVLKDKYSGLIDKYNIYDQPDEIRNIVKTIAILHRMSKTANTQDQLIKRTLHKPTEYILTTTDNGIESIPINIGKIFRESIKPIPKCLLTSATLTINKSFKYTLKTFGLPNSTPKALYSSPFNLKKQARLYMPLHVPLPSFGDTPERTKWVKELTIEIAQISGIIKGNILILFTSTTDKNEFFDILEKPLKDLNMTPIDQGQNAQGALKTYLNSSNPVLFGLKSFWEGIDLPGKALKCVIITKLPFPHPKDPIINTLAERATNGFQEINIPKMIFDMKQGTGRLIRSMSDKGIIVCLDCRIWSGTSDVKKHNETIHRIKNDPKKQRVGYGKQIVNALGYTIQSKLTAMEKWALSNLDYIDEE